MKRTRGAVLAAVLAVGASTLAACGADDDGDVVRLATGVDASYAVVYVAEENGYFEDHGVDVEVVKLEGGPAMAQAVIAGQADMGTQSDGTTVSLMSSAPDLRAIVDFQHSETYIKVVWGPDVKEASDIKKLATLPGVMTLATVRYLESQGVDADSVELVTASPPDVPVMLQRGDVDGTVIYEPWATRSAEESGGQIVGSIGDFGVSYAQWLITDEAWLKDNEDQAAKVAAAFADANDFIRENPEEAQKIIEDAIKIPAEQTAEIMPELVFETRDISDEVVAASKETAQFFVDTGAIKSMPDLDKQVITGWYTAHPDK